ncbi:golgin subfamily A member 6-like protein 22 [Trichomycterus rosablanca]|uniref:golgin subfamily A member 6-like protein 22 n=1 Tax=Trichomycterus rosablanca TaxID=2290929 RepID=UPI002F35B138
MEPDWGEHLNYWAQKQLRKERDVMDMIVIEIEELESQMQETGEDIGQGQRTLDIIETDRGDDMKNMTKEIEDMENRIQEFNKDIGQGQCTLDIIDETKIDRVEHSDYWVQRQLQKESNMMGQWKPEVINENKINWVENTTCELPERDMMEIMREEIEDMENTMQVYNKDIGQGQCTLDIIDETKINWGEHMTCGPPKQQNKNRMIKMMRKENKDLARKIQELETEKEELEELMGIERKRDKAVRKTLRKGMDPAIKEAEQEEQKKQRDQFLLIKSLRLKIEKLMARLSPDPKPESQMKITKKLGPAWTRMVGDKIKAEKKNQELLKQVNDLQAAAQLRKEKQGQTETELQSRLESGRLENKSKRRAEERATEPTPKKKETEGGNKKKSWFLNLISKKEKKWSEEKKNLELNREMERSYLELQLQTNEELHVSMMVNQAALKQKMLQELKQKQLRNMSETEMKERKKQEEKEWKEIEKEWKKAEKKKEAQNERKTKKWWKIRWFTKKL